MTLETILPPERVLYDVPGGSKKRVLEFYSTFIAQNIPSLDSQEVFSRLIGPIAGFLKLAEAIDFDAIDGDPVDLVFVLLVPEEADDTHLSLLGQVATIMNDADTRQQLRKAASQRELLELITAKIREQSAA